MDQLDRRILALLCENARMPVKLMACKLTTKRGRFAFWMGIKVASVILGMRNTGSRDVAANDTCSGLAMHPVATPMGFLPFREKKLTAPFQW